MPLPLLQPSLGEGAMQAWEVCGAEGAGGVAAARRPGPSGEPATGGARAGAAAARGLLAARAYGETAGAAAARRPAGCRGDEHTLEAVAEARTLLLLVLARLATYRYLPALPARCSARTSALADLARAPLGGKMNMDAGAGAAASAAANAPVELSPGGAEGGAESLPPSGEPPRGLGLPNSRTLATGEAWPSGPADSQRRRGREPSGLPAAAAAAAEARAAAAAARLKSGVSIVAASTWKEKALAMVLLVPPLLRRSRGPRGRRGEPHRPLLPLPGPCGPLTLSHPISGSAATPLAAAIGFADGAAAAVA